MIESLLVHEKFDDNVVQNVLVMKSKYDASCSYSSLSTLHSINLLTCLSSSGFAWGQARSNLVGVDMSKLHHYFTS